MSFPTALAKIHKNLIDTFEKAADAAVNGETDAEQVFRDFEKACKDAGLTSTDAIRDELKKQLTKQWMHGGMSKAEVEAQFGPQFGAKLKKVIDLGNKVIKHAPKVEAAAKSGWLKFVGMVTAIFAGAMAFVYIQMPSGPTPDQKAVLDMSRRAEVTVRQMEHLSRIVIREHEFYMMLRGLEVQSAPPPVISLPPPIAIAAKAPVKVQVTTPDRTQTFERTFAEVYVNAPPQVQEYMTNNPPETHRIEVDDAMRDRFRQDKHLAVDGTVDGTPWGSFTFSY